MHCPAPSRRLLALSLGLLLAFTGQIPAQAQLPAPPQPQARWGVGAKLPLIVYPDLYAAYEVADEAVVEASIPLHVLGEGISLVLAWKYLFGPLRISEYGVAIWPFGGAGASLSFFQGRFVYSFHLLTGMEYRPLNSRFRFFVELAVAFYGVPFPYSPAEGVFLGVRYAF